jgi:hypothetical protein
MLYMSVCVMKRRHLPPAVPSATSATCPAPDTPNTCSLHPLPHTTYHLRYKPMLLLPTFVGERD